MKKNERPPGSSKKERGGDTSRSSSQGRKLSSGGNMEKDRKGDPELNDDSKTPVRDEHRRDSKERKGLLDEPNTRGVE